MELRDYQHTMLDAARAHLRRGVRRIVLHAPTGSGKTVLTATMLGNAARNQRRSIFMVPKRELLNQSSATFRFAGIPHGIIAAGYMHDGSQYVNIASIQTVARRLAKIKPPDLVIWDEVHHLPSASWSRIYGAWGNAAHIGLTATPNRYDGRGLDKYFDAMVSGPSTRDLIAAGWLSPYRLFAPPGISVKGVHTRAGDYAAEELAAVVDKPTITGDAVAHYLRLCRGKRALAFCVSIQHSKHVAETFRRSGIPAAHIDGEITSEERDAAMRAFANGDVLVLTNCSLVSEGLDIGGIECVILLSPTQSKPLYLQRVGRALRIADGKLEAIINDHAGDFERHGLPDDDHEWSLAGRDRAHRTDMERLAPLQRCPQCFAVPPRPVLVCACGYRFVAESRIVKVVEGELTEVDVAAMRAVARREQGSAQTLEQLVAIGRARHHRHPELWARHILKARERKRRA